jgi:hypothetical protein
MKDSYDAIGNKYLYYTYNYLLYLNSNIRLCPVARQRGLVLLFSTNTRGLSLSEIFRKVVWPAQCPTQSVMMSLSSEVKPPKYEPARLYLVSSLITCGSIFLLPHTLLFWVQRKIYLYWVIRRGFLKCASAQKVASVGISIIPVKILWCLWWIKA